MIMEHRNSRTNFSFGDRDESRITFFIPLCLINVIYVRVLLLYYIFHKGKNILFRVLTFNLLTKPNQKLDRYFLSIFFPAFYTLNTQNGKFVKLLSTKKKFKKSINEYDSTIKIK